MSGTSVKLLVGKLSESVPGTSVAATGFGLALYAYEVHRMTSFLSVAPGDLGSLVPSLLSLATLITLALVYRFKPRFRLHRHPWSGFALAGTLTLSMLFSSGSPLPLSAETALAISAIQHAGELMLLLCWMEVLLPLPSRSFASLVALAMLVLAVLNGLSGLFKQSAVLALIALVPLLSMACLYWFKDKRESFDAGFLSARGASASEGIDISLRPRKTSRGAWQSSVLLFLAPLVGYPFIFGHVHYAWIPFQDGSLTSLAIQLAAASGTALAALLLLVLIAHFWGRRKIDLYNLLILPAVGITLYLTGMLHGSWVFLYVVPLNICQKMVLFLALLTPYLIPSKHPPLTTWCIAFFLYAFGKMLSTSVSSELDGGLYALFVIIFIVVLAGASIAGVVLDDDAVAREREGGDPDALAISSTTDAQLAPATTVATPEAEPNEEETLAAVCEAIARERRLTRREGEILQLLAEGMTAGDIAEELVVSTSTAKTHMRNIYLKLDIHTQSELLLIVHRKS